MNSDSDSSKTVVLLHNWGRAKNMHLFSGSADPASFGVASSKAHPTVFGALEAASKSLAHHFFEGPDRIKNVGDGLAEGYKMVEKKVVLKGDVSWSDLMQMRRSRSIYLGRRLPGGSYLTQIPVAEKIEATGVSILPLAEKVTLTDKGLQVKINGRDQDLVLPLDHPAAKAFADFGALARKLGLDPTALNFKAGSPLPFMDQEGMHGLSVAASQTPAEPDVAAVDEVAANSDGPSADELAGLGTPTEEEPGYSMESELSQDESNVSAAAPADETPTPEGSDAFSSSPEEAEPTLSPEKTAPEVVPVAKVIPQAPARVYVKDEIEVIHSPFVRLNGQVFNVSDLVYAALKTFALDDPARKILAKDFSFIGDSLSILEVAVGDNLVDLNASIADAADRAGVPQKPEVTEESLQRAKKEIFELGRQLYTAAGGILEKDGKAVEAGSPQITAEGRQLPSLPTGIPRPNVTPDI